MILGLENRVGATLFTNYTHQVNRDPLLKHQFLLDAPDVPTAVIHTQQGYRTASSWCSHRICVHPFEPQVSLKFFAALHVPLMSRVLQTQKRQSGIRSASELAPMSCAVHT